jgi:hypothetical protein
LLAEARERIDRKRCESEALASSQATLDRERVARQCLPADDLAQIEGEMFERREAARLRVEMPEIEAPAAGLASTVLAHETIAYVFGEILRRSRLGR